MAGIDFNRQVFTSTGEQAPQPASRILGMVLLVVALVAVGFVGYKVISASSRTEAGADSQGVEKIQQQLAEVEKRLDQLEKHRKVWVAEPAHVPSASEAKSAAAAPPPQRPAYKITAASAMPSQPSPARTPAVMEQRATPATGSSAPAESTANREAWQATTDRLADVVGVVGTQQSELSQAREDLNQLLAQTRRTAMSFELRRGGTRQKVGPVSLLLKAINPKTQRYSVCVYLDEQCIELKDRAVDEVVVFELTRNSAPLELVATKIVRDQLVGYLEVPKDK
jgi:hypothetical protein